MAHTVASTRLQQQKQHFHRFQSTSGSAVIPGCTDKSSAIFPFHPAANFVLSSLPALSALVAADYRTDHGRSEIIAK